MGAHMRQQRRPRPALGFEASARNSVTEASRSGTVEFVEQVERTVLAPPIHRRAISRSASRSLTHRSPLYTYSFVRTFPTIYSVRRVAASDPLGRVFLCRPAALTKSFKQVRA